MDNVSRRQFIAAGTAAAGAAWLASPREANASEEDSMERFGGFRVGIQSNVLNAYSPELEPMLDNIAELGLRWVEFANWHYEVTEDPQRIAQVQDMLQARGIRMEAYFLGEIEADADQLRRTFTFARQNGVSVLVGQPTPDAFPILDGLVKEFDIKVGVHNYGPGHRFDLIENLITAVAPWDWRIGYCPDTGHAMRAGEHPVEAVRRLGSRIHGFHLREHAAVQRDPQPPETIVGGGGMDLQALCRALRDVGFSGPLSFEVYYNPQDPMGPMTRSLANFAEAARATA